MKDNMKLLRILIDLVINKENELDTRILNQYLWIILHVFTDCENTNSELINVYMPIFAKCYDYLANKSMSDNLILTSLWFLKFFFRRKFSFKPEVS